MIETWKRYTPVSVAIVSDGTSVLYAWVTADDAVAAVELAKDQVLKALPYAQYRGVESEPWSSEDENAGPPFGYILSTQREPLKDPWWIRWRWARSQWFTRLRWRYSRWRMDRFMKKHTPKGFIR